MNYDQAIQKAEQIVLELEQAQALSMEEYKRKSNEVKQLLNGCEQELKKMETDLLV